MEEYQEYYIGLPIDNFFNGLKKLRKELKKYEGRRIESEPIFSSTVALFQTIPLSISEDNILMSFHVGAINSYRFGYRPLVINYQSDYHCHIISFSSLKILLYQDKIVCAGILAKGDEKVDCEYVFTKDC
ncbi:hypothetical protein GW758_01920 [Candidatus Falkowbacteria bacterium]|nr:hypothetical protein [Candidatus Falkowbacteria bacterium]